LIFLLLSKALNKTITHAREKDIITMQGINIYKAMYNSANGLPKKLLEENLYALN
jgi:hypothetical protein